MQQVEKELELKSDHGDDEDDDYDDDDDSEVSDNGHVA